MSTPSAQAQQDYRMDNNYENHYGKDSYKSKESSSVFVKKINCNNINVNVNGLDVNVLSPVINGLASEAQTADEGQTGASYYGSGKTSYGGQSGSDNDFKFICINNNNNNNTVVVGNGTTTPEPLTCEECLTTILTEDELNDLISTTIAFTSLEEICNFIDTSFESESQRLFINQYLFDATNDVNISTEKINAILDCLEEIYGVDFPRP